MQECLGFSPAWTLTGRRPCRHGFCGMLTFDTFMFGNRRILCRANAFSLKRIGLDGSADRWSGFRLRFRRQTTRRVEARAWNWRFIGLNVLLNFCGNSLRNGRLFLTLSMNEVIELVFSAISLLLIDGSGRPVALETAPHCRFLSPLATWQAFGAFQC